MKQVDWYIDFLSPFCYLQAQRLCELPAGTEVRVRPVLFAALLKHWGHKGPADIPPKRRFSFMQAQWQSQQLGIPFRLPPMHPFNPLRPLRLAIALDADTSVATEILRFIWGEGRDTDDAANWRALQERLGVTDADTLLDQPAVKEKLRSNTQAAVAAGVFGVPTVVADGELFWGADATGMLVAYLNDSEDLRRIVAAPAPAVASTSAAAHA